MIKERHSAVSKLFQTIIWIYVYIFIFYFYLFQALDLKKLQTPLYEEFYNSLNVAAIGNIHDESSPNYLKLPPKSRSPSRVANGTSTLLVEAANTESPWRCSRRVSNSGISIQSSREVPSPQPNEWRDLVDTKQEPEALRFVKLLTYCQIIRVIFARPFYWSNTWHPKIFGQDWIDLPPLKL